MNNTQIDAILTSIRKFAESQNKKTGDILVTYDSIRRLLEVWYIPPHSIVAKELLAYSAAGWILHSGAAKNCDNEVISTDLRVSVTSSVWELNSFYNLCEELRRANDRINNDAKKESLTISYHVNGCYFNTMVDAEKYVIFQKIKRMLGGDNLSPVEATKRILDNSKELKRLLDEYEN